MSLFCIFVETGAPSQRQETCICTVVDIHTHKHVRLMRELIWKKNKKIFGVKCWAKVYLCVHFNPVQCDSQSFGHWQWCMSMSCCCGSQELPSGTVFTHYTQRSILTRIMFKYFQRVAKGVFTKVFLKLNCTVLVWLLLHFVSAMIGLMPAIMKQANEAQETIISSWLNTMSSISNKTSHWFKTLTMKNLPVSVDK